MNRKRTLIAIAALLAIGVSFYFYGGHQAPVGQPPLARLTPENLSEIKNAFNAATSEVRVLVLLSPT
jgi:hypothetical protein